MQNGSVKFAVFKSCTQLFENLMEGEISDNASAEWNASCFETYSTIIASGELCTVWRRRRVMEDVCTFVYKLYRK